MTDPTPEPPPEPAKPEPAAESKFAGLGLDAKLLTALTALGYEEPTPIQKQAIPIVLQGTDLVGLAATGTGKTAAFALPLIQRLAAVGTKQKPTALILVPTRELAMQVAEAVHKYGRPFQTRVLPVYGGAAFGQQARALERGVDVVVATPGRALDHLRRGTLSLTGSMNYRSSVDTDLLNRLYSFRPAMTVLDATIKWAPENNSYSISLWGRNLTNNVQVLGYTPVGNTFAFGSPTPPRVYGVAMNVNF